ncbi:MAG: hypothetical protein HYU69_14830 [Bacteroidetes bacterium]|nr:hypothetical protein [Bacteroidota bacterium]
MKKVFLLFSASTFMLIAACGTGKVEEQTAPDTQAKTDSVQEQKNLDSLFNAASKNVDSAVDSAQKK